MHDNSRVLPNRNAEEGNLTAEVSTPSSQVPADNEEEKREVQWAFLKFVAAISFITLMVFLELAASYAADDFWLAVLGVPLLLFLLLTVPSVIGEHPFFSDKITRKLVRVRVLSRLLSWLSPSPLFSSCRCVPSMSSDSRN